MKDTNHSKAARAIEVTIRASGKRVFGQKELVSLVSSAKRKSGAPDDTPATALVDELVELGALEKRVFASDRYDPYVRYTLPGTSIFETAVSLKTGAYLSHGTAVFLHHLGLQLPRTIYVNKEQSVKPAPAGQLSQEGIDRAFAGQQRESQHVLSYDDWRIVMLNGKNTGNLEVGELKMPEGAAVPATKLERTLIDIAVRPNYAGGVPQRKKTRRLALSPRGRADASVAVPAELSPKGRVNAQCIDFRHPRSVDRRCSAARSDKTHRSPAGFETSRRAEDRDRD